MRKLTIIILIALGTLILSACSSQDGSGITPAPDKLTFLFFYTDG